MMDAEEEAYWPAGAGQVEWLLLASEGTGLEAETLKPVTARPRLTWLGCELVRREARGRTAWTWRRTKQEMAELYALLTSQAQQRHYAVLADTLERIARQPGLHGVRTQSWALCQEACRLGYPGELPHLHYLQKVSHREHLILAG
ncbi:hypothetical protein C2134_03840 [Chromobacterium sinusclupearum]|uniref:Uncharacterized protein n=2 Tax=Chromobacterium sinusclupearum TaxID=2077146 RepID=A0A2K4MS20_9NEIS|nr:hypothetical protein C2134_03840 [Chromobacterium sinusclupearum]